MMNYPYPTTFMAPLPGWPVKETCRPLKDSSMENHKLMQALFEAVSVYFNYTGKEKCLNTSVMGTEDLGDSGWNFQACTEMVMPMCADGIKDMFEPTPWDYEAFAENCEQTYKVKPRQMMAPLIYGGRDIKASSNIIFSNGDLDPWSGGGVMESLSDSLVSVFIRNGAHHLDLRSKNANDTIWVVKARQTEKSYIQKFIKSYKPIKRNKRTPC